MLGSVINARNPMILDTRSHYPSARTYVLKLHRDAPSDPASLCGRLENMASGRHVDFTCAEQLVAWLTADIAASGAPRVE